VARVLLVMPKLPEPLGAPYLGQLYLAAALLRAGHEVRALDLAARAAPSEDDALREAARWGPDVVGVTLFTLNAARGYALAARLGAALPGALLVAGGPHVTACPDEPLAHGFHATVAGEGEEPVVVLAARAGRALGASAGGGARLEVLDAVPGLRRRGGAGPANPARASLDGMAPPHEGYGAFQATWYGLPVGAPLAPGGVMTSRGCPARCTFCANHVTGRVFRWRSAADVVGELLALEARFGLRHFAFWDDAFTASRPRLEALCDALSAEPALDGVTWSCITPGIMVKPRDLARMRRAGCVAVNFGIESGDPSVLKAIGKGQRPRHVRAAVRAAKAEGMAVVVNFMFGFPGEGVEELGRTRVLMEELAPDVDAFNTRGVVIPMPGTPLYERYADAFGFRGWWLQLGDALDAPHHASARDAMAWEARDPALEMDFFQYREDVRRAIEAAVRFKAEHNLRRLRGSGLEGEV